jgi:chromosome segregation ATPase
LDAAGVTTAQLHKELMQAQRFSDTLSAELEHYKALQENHSTSVSALQTQASELQRLNAEVDSLGQDFQAARAEVTRLQEICTRQEGEAAGLRLALRNSEEDLQSLLEENNQLSNQSSSESRKLQELRDELSRLNTELQLAKNESYTTSQRPQQVRRLFYSIMDHLFILFIAFIYIFVCIDTRQADPIDGYGYSILAAESQCA